MRAGSCRRVDLGLIRDVAALSGRDLGMNGSGSGFDSDFDSEHPQRMRRVHHPQASRDCSPSRIRRDPWSKSQSQFCNQALIRSIAKIKIAWTQMLYDKSNCTRDQD